MALLGNRSVLHKSPGRFLSGSVSTAGAVGGYRSSFTTHGMLRSAYQAYSPLSATPMGHLAPSAWVLPKTAGGISSQNVTKLNLTPSGLAVGGITADATTSISFTVADAAGELISSGSGAASMTFTVANLLLTASLNAIGSTSLTITSNTPQLGAKASAIGSANFAVTGSMIPYAIGSLSGSTVDSGILTVDAIAAGVLAAALTSPIYADIRRVNNTEVDGNGQPGTEWGPV